MYHHRPHVVHLDCVGCQKPIARDQVLVYYDTSGCEGDATDPAHLACYLEAMDPGLSTNAALADHARRVVTAALDAYLG
jgi:hypothetical protein